jgi:hypothetical protein
MNAHFYPGVGDPYDLTIPEFFELLGEIDDVMRRRLRAESGTTPA